MVYAFLKSPDEEQSLTNLFDNSERSGDVSWVVLEPHTSGGLKDQLVLTTIGVPTAVPFTIYIYIDSIHGSYGMYIQ